MAHLVEPWNAVSFACTNPVANSWQDGSFPVRGAGVSCIRRRPGRLWLSDFGANALVRFDPALEEFRSLPPEQPGKRPPDPRPGGGKWLGAGVGG